MATDHGFNVGLPDNLGMFNVFSIIHCVHFSNHTFKTFSNLFVIVISPCPLMQMRYPRHVPSGYLFFFSLLSSKKGYPHYFNIYYQSRILAGHCVINFMKILSYTIDVHIENKRKVEWGIFHRPVANTEVSDHLSMVECLNLF